jgi:hypothetical protein
LISVHHDINSYTVICHLCHDTLPHQRPRNNNQVTMNQSNSFLTYIVYFSYFVTVTKEKVTNTGLNFFAITLLAQIVTCPSPIREVKLACLFLIKKKNPASHQ